jgi:hypothetical protein
MADETETSLNPFTNLRILRINALKEKIQKNPEMALEQLIAIFSIDTGAAPKRVREYIQTLIESKQVTLYQKGVNEYLKLTEEIKEA